MTIKTPETTNLRPQLFRSLRLGFDAVATHIGLILLPILVDIFLWLGPHYGVKPLAEKMQASLAGMVELDSRLTELVQANQEIWRTIGDQFNLAILIRTYPVGVPSLMIGRMPGNTPMGPAAVYQLQSIGELLLWMLFFGLLGAALGTLYFTAVARTVSKTTASTSVLPAWSTLQVVLLAVVLLAVLLAINTPAFILLYFLSMISPAVAQVAIFIYSLVLIWMLVPLVFAPHGIFLYRQNAIASILISVRLVRFIMPAVSIFIIAVILLTQGLDLLWEQPQITSWMSLVGIAGHAFVTTSLVAASFVFYQDAVNWIQEALKRSLLTRKQTSQV